MPRTPDRYDGDREETATIYEDTDPTVTSQEGEVRYGGGSFKMRDATGEFDPRVGGGISVPQHQALDTLVHDLSENAFTEPTFGGPSGRMDGSVTWTDAGKTLKIRECQLSYTGPLVTQVVTIQYDGAGTEVERLTETIVYVPGTTRVASITAVRLP